MTKPYIIVLGNEKGGTGKSTVAMHIVTALTYRGYTVGCIDVDARQGTLSRYIDNRRHRVAATGENLTVPQLIPVFRSEKENRMEAVCEEEVRFAHAYEDLRHNDCIVIDTPGSDTHLSRLAHSYADILVTPVNDSFIDLDMLVRISGDQMNVLRPSTYAEMVWDQKKQKATRDGGKIDWVVVRNRISNIHSRNREELIKVLNALSKRIGFKLLSGFGERVIFRELFLKGLTLLDMKDSHIPMTLSHLTAKQELLNLIDALNIPLLQVQKTA